MMESFLALVGILPECRRAAVSDELYRYGRSEPDETLLITTLLIHHDPEGLVEPRWPIAKTIQLRDALRFIHRRFNEYHNVKLPHGQWAPSGQALWDRYRDHRNDDGTFVQVVLHELGSSP